MSATDSRSAGEAVEPASTVILAMHAASLTAVPVKRDRAEGHSCVRFELYAGRVRTTSRPVTDLLLA